MLGSCLPIPLVRASFWPSRASTGPRSSMAWPWRRTESTCREKTANLSASLANRSERLTSEACGPAIGAAAVRLLPPAARPRYARQQLPFDRAGSQPRGNDRGIVVRTEEGLFQESGVIAVAHRWPRSAATAAPTRLAVAGELSARRDRLSDSPFHTDRFSSRTTRPCLPVRGNECT